MTVQEELKLILKLIGKYSLPLSPILEYAIKEKIEEFGGSEAEIKVSSSEDDVVGEKSPVQVEEEFDNKPIVNDNSKGIRIVNFGVRTIAIVGNVQEHKDELKALGGYYVVRSQWGPAWVFRSKKREKLQAFIDGKVIEAIPPIRDCHEEAQSTNSSRYIIRVKYPNGSVFSSDLVWETLVDVVNYAGPERVRQLNMVYLGDNLITPRLNDNPQYRRAQKRVGRGLYVSTCSSTDVKYKQIERINEELQLGLKVEKVFEGETEEIPYVTNVRSNSRNEVSTGKYDKTKYSIEGGEWLNKRRFVLEVVKFYVSTHPGVTYETLLRIFPSSLHPNKSKGVIKRYNDVLKQISINPDVRNRFFLKEDEIIELANGMKIVVHNQWGDNTDKFLDVARKLFRIRASNDEESIYDMTSVKAPIGNVSAVAPNNEDQRIGYVVRLFPSQQVGVIVSVKTDGKGIRQLVVQTNEGNTMAVDDLPYLYEVIKKNANSITPVTKENQERKENTNPEEATIELTEDIIEAARTPNGGFTKSQLAAVGIAWPPPEDWIEEKVGTKITPSQLADFNRIEYKAKPSEASYRLTGTKTYKDIAASLDDRRKMEAILQAMTHFYTPATPYDIARAISRTAWGSNIVREETVDSFLKLLPEVEYIKWGKYILKSRIK